jgi:aspartate ammonia-lyase
MFCSPQFHKTTIAQPVSSLNVTMPIVTLKLREVIQFTANVINAFTEKCVTGIDGNEARGARPVDRL